MLTVLQRCHHALMGILTDYFIAPDAAAAAGALLQGPASTFTTLEGNGIEPTVHLWTLEEILTGRSFEEILDDESDPIAEDDDGSLVLPVSELLLDVLIDAPAERIQTAAEAWSTSEELAGADPEALVAFLDGLAELARAARAAHSTIYCWVCV